MLSVFVVNFIVTLDGFTDKEPSFFDVIMSQQLFLQYQRDFHYKKKSGTC